MGDEGGTFRRLLDVRWVFGRFVDLRPAFAIGDQTLDEIHAGVER